MLLNFLLMQKETWFIPFVLQAISYVGVLRKMGIPTKWAIIPCCADFQLTKRLYPRHRAFWRPFFVSVLLVLAALYLNPVEGSGRTMARIFIFVAIFVYEVFLFRLHRRLAKAFGRPRLLALLTLLLPPLVPAILGYGKAKYLGDPEFKHLGENTLVLKYLIRLGYAAMVLVEAVAIVGVIGILTVRTKMPRVLVNMIQSDVLEETKDVTGTGTVVTREEAMGDAVDTIASLTPSREKFFPDHSSDQSVVVLEYVIGADLEEAMGLASANISQMIDATRHGSALTFVLEAGGSSRWFTAGIADGSYGRYAIRDGALSKVADLPDDTCMSEPDELASFLAWAKEAYPADRYILVFWDHGGGFSTGYGVDSVNERKGDLPTLSVSDLAGAIDSSGITFDIIGFDACLMQDIEVAVALEPYADYLLASEEVEGGYGWSYTSAFGMLAENPGIPSEDFGREIVACYDPYNTIINSGEPDTAATLSFVDLPLAKAAYEQLEGFFDIAHDAVLDDSTAFSNISMAGTKSYVFSNDEQVDLVDFLQVLDHLDYGDEIIPDEEREALIDALRACVLFRNGNSAEGINGIALNFPVRALGAYGYSYPQLGDFSFDTQRDFYSDFFSIIAAQRKNYLDNFEATESTSLTDYITALTTVDYTDEEWYREGFETYENTPAFIDIPLTEVEDGYQVELPDEAWEIISDSYIIAYQRANDGSLRYLGMDDLGATDDAGHPLVAMDGTWVHVGGRLCCYQATGSRLTEEGTIFTGRTKALVNGVESTIYIEWDPITEESADEVEGHVTGYIPTSLGEVLSFVEAVDPEFAAILTNGKALRQFQPGDRVELLFDYYDDVGELVRGNVAEGSFTVTNQERVVVSDMQLPAGNVVFGGTYTDVYQRTMSTEKIEATIA